MFSYWVVNYKTQNVVRAQYIVANTGCRSSVAKPMRHGEAGNGFSTAARNSWAAANRDGSGPTKRIRPG